MLTNLLNSSIIGKVDGEVAQLARAFGSYPKGHVFESHLRYHKKQDISIYFEMSCFLNI